MTTIKFRQSLVAITLLATAAMLSAPITAQAREGARSIGNGIKCSTRSMVNPNGTVSYYQYCYKGV